MIEFNEEVILRDIRKKIGITQLNGKYYVPFDEIKIDGAVVIFSNNGKPIFSVPSGCKLLDTAWFPESEFSSN